MTENTGVLTAYDRFLSSVPKQALLTIGGYNFEGFDWTPKADARSVQLTRLANAIDHAIRQAIDTIYPDMLYPSEPNALMKALDKTHHDGIFDLEQQKAKLEAALRANPDEKRKGEFFGIGQNEGRTAMLNIRQEAGDGYSQDYLPSAGISTDPLPGNAERGLEVTQDTANQAMSGTLRRDGEVYNQPERMNPYTAVSTQSQSYADPRTLAREYRKSTPGITKDDGGALRSIFTPVEAVGRAKVRDPSLTEDSDEIKHQLDEVKRRLDEETTAMEHDKKACAAYAHAAEVAKTIIRAMTAQELNTIWEQLKPLLDQIQREFEQAKKAKHK